MSLLDTIAPRRGSSQRRYGRMFLAKTAFYVAVVLSGIFVLASFYLFDKDRELELIPATRSEAEVFNPLQEYLMITEVQSIDAPSVMVNCWDEFGDTEFKFEYLNYGSWRINAYYNLVRYHWRVDDLSLEVTRDPWLRTNNPTIRC
ncbi:MAG: hypothetical protein HQ477_00435 [Chloroflexi bacterium]|nr:hypothetical protein [Chloroflexota bacterium]